jgi:nicotinamidase-related amidase
MVLELHEQWRSLNFGRLLTERAAFISMDAQNSILDPSGVLSHEGIWKGARDDDGSLSNIIRLAASARKVGMPFFWLRYDRFIGEKQSSTELDRVQYNYWNENYAGDASRKEWECDLVSDVKAILRPGDVSLVYPGWSIFTGTGLDRWLTQLSVRTLILSGYHTDWCVEMAARHARELGLIPVVIGDACGTTQPLHSQTLEQINSSYAPVLSTAAAIDYIEAALRHTAGQSVAPRPLATEAVHAAH